jgi:hypothetical protein
MLGLSLAAATVALALIGAGSATATALCKTNAGGSSCKKTDAYPSGTKVSAAVTPTTSAVFSLGAPNETTSIVCDQSALQLTTSAQQAAALPAAMAWSNSQCSWKWEGFSIACQVSSSGSSTAISFTQGANGNVSITPGANPPSLQWLCGSNPGVPATNCEYRMDPGASFQIEGGNPAVIKASAVKFSSAGAPGCPATATLTATYTVQSPSPLYVSKSII